VLGKNVYGNIEAIPPAINSSIMLIEKETIKPISSKEMSFRFRAASEGTWGVVFKVNNQTEYSVPILVDDEKYSSPLHTKFQGKDLSKIIVGNRKKIVLDWGFLKMGWLGTYIIFSIVFSMLLRKILKLH